VSLLSALTRTSAVSMPTYVGLDQISHAWRGGLDIKVSKHIALRPIEADDYLVHPTSFVS